MCGKGLSSAARCPNVRCRGGSRARRARGTAHATRWHRQAAQQHNEPQAAKFQFFKLSKNTLFNSTVLVPKTTHTPGGDHHGRAVNTFGLTFYSSGHPYLAVAAAAAAVAAATAGPTAAVEAAAAAAATALWKLTAMMIGKGGPRNP